MRHIAPLGHEMDSTSRMDRLSLWGAEEEAKKGVHLLVSQLANGRFIADGAEYMWCRIMHEDLGSGAQARNLSYLSNGHVLSNPYEYIWYAR